MSLDSNNFVSCFHAGVEDTTESRIYKKILGDTAGDLLDSIIRPLAAVLRTGAMQMGAVDGLEEKVAQLCEMASAVWCVANIPEEAPSPEWLLQYLGEDLTQGIYQAFSKADLVWAIYSYFSWNKPDFSAVGAFNALGVLAEVAALHVPDNKMVNRSALCGFTWPEKTYASLGLGPPECYVVKQALLYGDSKRLQTVLMDFIMWEKIFEGGKFFDDAEGLKLHSIAMFTNDNIIPDAGFGPLVVRDVAQYHSKVSPVESAKLVKDVLRWLQTNGGYLVKNPE